MIGPGFGEEIGRRAVRVLVVIVLAAVAVGAGIGAILMGLIR